MCRPAVVPCTSFADLISGSRVLFFRTRCWLRLSPAVVRCSLLVDVCHLHLLLLLLFFVVVVVDVPLFTQDAGCMCRPAVVPCTIFADLMGPASYCPHKMLAASVSYCSAVPAAR